MAVSVPFVVREFKFRASSRMGRILSRFFRYLPNSVVPAQARICPGPQLTDTSMLGRIPAFAGMTLKTRNSKRARRPTQ
jgi:hypothetical protein